MNAGTTFFLSGLTMLVMCCAICAASKRTAAAWNYYHFDGDGFAAGPSLDGSRFLAVSDRSIPVVIGRNERIVQVPLPGDKGAMAGICYISSSGGRQASGSAYAPSPGASITITSSKGVSASTPADESGFFVAVLAAGSYTVSHGAFSSRVSVEKGTTALVPLRAGKRMVD